MANSIRKSIGDIKEGDKKAVFVHVTFFMLQDIVYTSRPGQAPQADKTVT